MKLLPKKTIDVQVAAQRKAQIDEGVVIAKKIDALRQTYGSLETQHKAFLDGMKKSLDDSNRKLIESIAHKKLEIEELEEKRSRLLEPLTYAWEEVKLEKKRISEVTNSLDDRELRLAAKEENIRDRDKKSKDSLNRINIRERELSAAYQEADEARTEILEIKKTVSEFRESSKKDIELRYQDIRHKEEQNQYSFEFCERKKSELDARECALNDRERSINDKYETLQRTINRIK